MNVTFITEIANRLSLNIRDGRKIIFVKGKYSTTDKDEISQILGHELYRKGLVRLADREDVVGDYLENDEADEYITSEFLDGISVDGIMVLGEFLSVPGKVSKVVKPSLIGLPLSSEVQKIADQYRSKSVKDRKVEKV